MTATTSQPLIITKDLLRKWHACSDGYAWFARRFPGGATYVEVQRALRADGRCADAQWLAANVSARLFRHPQFASEWAEDLALATSELIEQTDPAAIVQSSSASCAQIGSSGYRAQIGSSGNYAQIGSSGYRAQIGSIGYYAQIGSSGNDARIASSGNDAQIGSSGNYARIASSGNDARIGSSGDYARIGSSGNDARINAEGSGSVVVCAGYRAVARAGSNGAIALTWLDGIRHRIAVGYVGEGLKADTWYGLDETGQFVEVEVPE